MCRSCKVIADVHRRPRLGLESLASSVIPASTTVFNRKEGHSAVDEVLESWSEAACGKAFLALTDLINFENDFHQQERDRHFALSSEQLSLSKSQAGCTEPFIYPQLPAFSSRQNSFPTQPHRRQSKNVSSSILQSECINCSTGIDSVSKTAEHYTQEYSTPKLNAVCNPHRSDDSFGLLTKDSPLTFITQSLIEQENSSINESTSTITGALDASLSSNTVIGPYPVHTLTTTPRYQNSSTLQIVNPENAVDESLTKFFGELLQNTGVKEDNMLTSLSNPLFQCSNSFQGSLEKQQSTKSPETAISFALDRIVRNVIREVLGSSFVDTKEHQSVAAPNIPSLLPHSTNILQTGKIFTMSSTSASSGTSCTSEYSLEPGLITPIIQSVEIFDFRVFQNNRHPFYNFIKEANEKRVQLIINARRAAMESDNSKISMNKSSSTAQLKHYQYFWRAAIKACRNSMDPLSLQNINNCRRILLLNLSNVLGSSVERSIVVEDGRLIVRLPISTSKDFRNWKLVPIQTRLNSSATMIGGRRKFTMSEEMMAINKMSRRQVIREILVKCNSCNMKELDVLLSSFIASHSQSLTTPQLRQLLHVLGSVPKQHVFNWMSGQAELPTRRLIPLRYFENNKEGQTSNYLWLERFPRESKTGVIPVSLSPTITSSYHPNNCHHNVESANEWRENFAAGQLLLAYINANHPLLKRFRYVPQRQISNYQRFVESLNCPYYHHSYFQCANHKHRHHQNNSAICGSILKSSKSPNSFDYPQCSSDLCHIERKRFLRQ